MWLNNNDKVTADKEFIAIQAFIDASRKNHKTVGVRDLFRDCETIKGIVIGLGLLIGQQTNGIYTIIMYASTIFAMTNSSLSPNTSAIVVGSMQIFGSLLSSFTVERAGRRILLLTSSVGMAICHCILATFLLLENQNYDVSSFNWIPVVALSCFSILYCIGIGPLGYVVACEVLRSDISSLIHAVSMNALNITAFLVSKCFIDTSHLIGIYGCFYLYAVFCMCTCLFTYFLVPETKGRSVESILEDLSGPKKINREESITNISLDVNHRKIEE